jgi:hypothetical protein
MAEAHFQHDQVLIKGSRYPTISDNISAPAVGDADTDDDEDTGDGGGLCCTTGALSCDVVPGLGLFIGASCGGALFVCGAVVPEPVPSCGGS